MVGKEDHKRVVDIFGS